MWVETGFPPSAFWEQTERSFSNTLAGAARLRIKTAWQTGAFAGAASNGKLKEVEHYLPDDEEPTGTPGAMKFVSLMHKLRRKGLPITIERIERLH